MFDNTHTRLSLQLFADSGTMVNTTGGTANAYTGETTTSANWAPGLKTFYETQLLENARHDMIFTQFADHVALPAHHGNTIEFRKFNTFAHAGQLQEGVVPSAQPFGETKIEAYISQWGTYTAISDILDTRNYDPVIIGATEEMAASMAETQEVLLRDSLLSNPNVLYADNVDKATGKATGTTPLSCEEMECSDTVIAMITPATLALAATIMKKNRVPQIRRGGKGGGKYAIILHPSVTHDLRMHPDWMEVHKYSATEEIFSGEVGQLHGFYIIESLLAPVLDGDEYANKAGTVTYASFAFGKDAFATIDPGEGNARLIIKDRKEIGGPLEQWSTVGYKFETGSIVKYPERLLRIMSCTSFSGVDEAN